MMTCIQNLVRFCQFVLKILSGNEILTSIKGRNSVKILRKMTGNNPKLDLVNVDVHTKGQGSRMAKIGPVSEINEIWTQDRRRSPEIENAFLKRDVIIKHF